MSSASACLPSPPSRRRSVRCPSRTARNWQPAPSPRTPPRRSVPSCRPTTTSTDPDHSTVRGRKPSMTTATADAPAAATEAKAPNPLKKIWSDFFGFLQKLGKSLMLPVAVLPVAGILLGVGGAFIGNYKQAAIDAGYCTVDGVAFAGDKVACLAQPPAVVVGDPLAA